MAKLDTSGFDQFAFDFDELASIPDSVVDEMLLAEGEVMRRAQAESAQRMLQGKYYKGAVASAARVGKIKRSADGKHLFITFQGIQHGTNISEIAFLNEFGKKNQPSRQFIRTAIEKHTDEAVDAAEKVLYRYLGKIT